MPRRKLTLDQKIDNAKKQIKRFIKKYDSKDHLSILASDYRRNKNPALKTANNDYLYLKKYQKIVQSYKDRIIDSSDDEEIPPNYHHSAAQDPPVRLQFLSSQSNDQNMNHILCQEADSSGSITESDNEDTTRREVHCNNPRRQERNNNLHENNEEVNEENVTVDKCDNCCRKQNHLLINKYGDTYELIFHQVPIQQIKRQRKFKMFKTEDRINFLLCQQCFIHITSETSTKMKR